MGQSPIYRYGTVNNIDDVKILVPIDEKKL